jgi:hypothetical protein
VWCNTVNYTAVIKYISFRASNEKYTDRNKILNIYTDVVKIHTHICIYNAINVSHLSARRHVCAIFGECRHQIWKRNKWKRLQLQYSIYLAFSTLNAKEKVYWLQVFFKGVRLLKFRPHSPTSWNPAIFYYSPLWGIFVALPLSFTAQHTHATGGIRTRNASKRLAADRCHRPPEHIVELISE